MFKSRTVFFIVLIALSAVSIGGCRRVGVWLVKEDVPMHADAIVLLMGNFTDRVLQTADLYGSGRADRVIIAEESMGGYQGLIDRGVTIISHTSQALSSLVALGVPAESITVLPGDARSTLDEAVIVRNYLEANPEIDTLVLVSSPYHLRRASMIFGKAFEEAGLPVFTGTSGSGAYTDFDASRWWRSKEDIQHVLTEVVKIGGFITVEGRRLTRE
ncbi:MAG: YdcF family protein [Bacteroidales bacterium]|nr:YdcF family protein [Bacteroidales bacterium]MDT8375049.1 YdcF family protein [Bacteroidales bacterium]